MLNGTPRANRKCIENEPRALGGSDVMQILKAGVLYFALVSERASYLGLSARCGSSHVSARGEPN